MTFGDVDVEVLPEERSDAGDKLLSSKSTLFPVLPLFPPPSVEKKREKQITRGKNMVADGWRGAYKPLQVPLPHRHFTVYMIPTAAS